MTILKGRAGTVTERDFEIFSDLFFCERLTIEQVAERHFERHCELSPRAMAKKRLYALRRKGYLDNQAVSLYGGGKHARRRPGDDPTKRSMNFFHLTKEGHEAVADQLGLDWPHRKPPALEPRDARHLKELNDLYLDAKEDLDALLGEPPAWLWRSEHRAFFEYTDSGEQRSYRPDAEVLLGEVTYVLERQTSRKRISPGGLAEKVVNHKNALGSPQLVDRRAVVLFACDERRDVAAVLRAAATHRLELEAGTPQEIANLLVARARETRGAAARGGDRGAAPSTNPAAPPSYGPPEDIPW